MPAPSPPKQEELYGRLEEDKEAKVSRCLLPEIPCKTDCVSGMRTQARSSELTEAVRSTSEIPESEDVPVSASTKDWTTVIHLTTEVSRHIVTMMRTGVIRPSQSPWASLVVLVRKKDGSLRFCIDYRLLNSVTKPDLFPLPRIDELLYQLGKSRYFSTLDIALGYWQIKVHPQSQEKTAFVTNQGLVEFRVMPFGLMNAPAVFQRLMQQVLSGLNPIEGPDFVAVYLDDVLVFSETMQDHLVHLRRVLDRIAQAGLKLRPAKCHLVRQEVDYLGHVITPEGLLPNTILVDAVRNFVTPANVREV